ncbi:MAG: TonB-dependent receptor, partial [Novosphingobium sp.]|nr:TonB-dependent receptor [Novosphingobium sp.]
AALSALYFPADEKSKSFELGLKTDWLNRRLRFNLTAYHQTFKNFAFSSRSLIFGGVNSGGGNEVFTAAPAIAVGVPAKVQGVELELAFQATPNWSMAAIASYSKSKLRNATVPCNDYNPIDGQPDSVSTLPTFAQVSAATGGDLVQFCNSNARAGSGSPFSATLQSEYNMPISNNIDGYLRGLLTYNGNSLNDPLNAFDDVKSYAVVNFFAGVRAPDGAWSVGLFAKNIFNSQRAVLTGTSALTTSYRTLVGAQNGQTSYRSVTYTDPREFGITAKVAIGSR